MPEKYDLCECNHYYFLHDIFSRECQACDDSNIPIDKRCLGFKIKG